jgi:hypothetical protein
VAEDELVAAPTAAALHGNCLLVARWKWAKPRLAILLPPTADTWDIPRVVFSNPLAISSFEAGSRRDSTRS